MRTRPITIFLIGLLVGVGYISTSFYIDSVLLEKKGGKVTSEMEEFQKLSETYTKDSQKIESLQSEIQEHINFIEFVSNQNQTYVENFQQIITRLVQNAKSHNLTFLDFHSQSTETLEGLPEVSRNDSQLSIGGNFKNILAFLEDLENNVESNGLPIVRIQFFASQEGQTRLQLFFSYLNHLNKLLDNIRAETQNESQS